MNANSTSFWIGKKTSAYCPPNVPEMGGVCPPGKDTVLVGGSALNVEVPGGQQVYIAPGGALKFTAPHSASMPPGSIKSGFEYEPGNPFGHWTWKGQSGSGWMACPADGAYQVFANVKDAEVPSGNVADCIGFDAMAVADKSNSPAAWEYA
ncbi:IgE-binding protein [Aspergillus sclerotialis]|uniref:IgE-binding protein n=1 Tax=Aspergillus sclerotialis TaxID=2070753 RepID=A0A3A2ZT52_9EURO|nr:IgE-binding protein [Aspergillus sclerotialis]